MILTNRHYHNDCRKGQNHHRTKQQHRERKLRRKISLHSFHLAFEKWRSRYNTRASGHLNIVTAHFCIMHSLLSIVMWKIRRWNYYEAPYHGNYGEIIIFFLLQILAQSTHAVFRVFLILKSFAEYDLVNINSSTHIVYFLLSHFSILHINKIAYLKNIRFNSDSFHFSHPNMVVVIVNLCAHRSGGYF